MDDLREASSGPSKYDRSLPELWWDGTASRDHALRASNPSGDKKAACQAPTGWLSGWSDQGGHGGFSAAAVI